MPPSTVAPSPRPFTAAAAYNRAAPSTTRSAPAPANRTSTSPANRTLQAAARRVSPAPANRAATTPINAPAPTRGATNSSNRGQPSAPKPEPKILHQKFFKSVGPRTYAAQLKEAANGNHFLVLTEGKRDEKTGEVRKTRLYVYSEDFTSFFTLMKETADGVRTHPLPDAVRRKREAFWKRQSHAKTNAT